MSWTKEELIAVAEREVMFRLREYIRIKDYHDRDCSPAAQYESLKRSLAQLDGLMTTDKV